MFFRPQKMNKVKSLSAAQHEAQPALTSSNMPTKRSGFCSGTVGLLSLWACSSAVQGLCCPPTGGFVWKPSQLPQCCTHWKRVISYLAGKVLRYFTRLSLQLSQRSL